MLGEPREFRIHPHLQAGCKKRKALEQSFDVRIRAFESVKREATGDFGEFSGELAAHFAKVRELAVVVFQKARIHVGILARSVMEPDRRMTKRPPRRGGARASKTQQQTTGGVVD